MSIQGKHELFFGKSCLSHEQKLTVISLNEIKQINKP